MAALYDVWTGPDGLLFASALLPLSVLILYDY
jgi:hypothetical protein